MKNMKINRWLSIAIIVCLVITSTPLQAITAEINEERQWQEIITTFEGDQNKNSLDAEITTSETVQNSVDTKKGTLNEKQFTLEAANKEFKTDRFIVKYKEEVELTEIVVISDMKADSKGRENLERISDSIDENKVLKIDRIEKKDVQLEKIRESIPVEIDTAQLELSQTPIDSATIIETENIMVLDTQQKMTGTELKDVLKTKKIGKDIEYIQPDYELGMSSMDPYLNEQWGHYQIYQPVLDDLEPGEVNTEAPYQMDANVLEAWKKTKGDGAVVALLDTGIETTHVDLQDNLLAGWDFVNNDDSVNDFGWKYDQWHGTHIAGIIAAEAVNNVGVAGVAPEAKILPLKVFQGGTAYTSDIISAMKYAEICGAKIANCSWGTLYDNPALKGAIENSNMIFVCAAGNSLYNMDKYPVYPAAYELENVLSVTSIDQDGRLSRFANYGKETVDIAAPGRDIYSTTIDNGFAKNNGTSMSAGYVSGALALLLSKDPTKTAVELKARIVSSGDIVTGLRDKVKDGRKLNCEYALSINPFPNFNTIVVNDDEPLSEISPNGETGNDDYETYAENTISIKTPMPTARHGLGVIAVGDKIYAIGGQLSSGYSNKVEEYDPKTDTWTTKANMPTASSYFGIAKINDQIYILGGYNGSYQNKVQVYNPVTNIWTTMPTSHNMPVAMRSFAATAYNGKIYVTGGYTGSYRNTVYEYNPVTGAWNQKQSLLNNRGEHVSVEYGGKIYIDGGCTTSGNWLNVEEVYDPSTNTVQQIGHSKFWSINGAAVSNDERYTLIGGKETGIAVYDNTIFNYNISNGDFINAFNMYYSRSGLGAAEVNGRIFLIGGINATGILAVVEEVDLGWEFTTNLPVAAKNFTSIECNGKLYIIGGEVLLNGVNTKIKSVYEYNPEIKSWTQKEDMPQYRTDFGIATAYGKIYIIGGRGNSTGVGTLPVDNKVYEFDPMKNQWIQKASISEAKECVGATNFNNLIYIAGGLFMGKLSTVEAYDPLNNTWQRKANLPSVNYSMYLSVCNNKLIAVGSNLNILEYSEGDNTWQIKMVKGPFNVSRLSENSKATIYGNIYDLNPILWGERESIMTKYDPLANKYEHYFTMYLFDKAYSIATLNNKIYAFSGASGYATKMIEYRPSVSPWLRTEPTDIISAYMGICTIDKNVYHIGGAMYDENTSRLIPTNGVYKLNTQTDYWSTIQSMNYSRCNLVAGTINGKVYAAGGSNSTTGTTALAYLEEYNPTTNTWATKASIPAARRDMASATYNGKLYLFGGRNGSSVYNTTYIYNPSTNTWTTGATMPTARYGCSSALLSDGKIYVVGGSNSSNTPLKKLEVYDPSTNTWSAKQDLPVALTFSGASGIDSLYVVGGKDSASGNGLVYEYSPITNKWFSYMGTGLSLCGSGVTIADNALYVINGQDISDTIYGNSYRLPLASYKSDYIHLGEERINLSGNLARNYTDMSYTSQGFQLNFSRTYNARDDRTDGNIISKGWTFGFQGKVSSAGNDTLVRLPNGSGYYFKENIDGTFVAKDSRSTLSKQTDGSYIMTTKDLYSYGFNNSGYLTWMKDRNGNTITITVDSTGKITRITDPVGRQTNITYSSNRINTITDFAGRVVTYAYNTSGYLSTVTDPMGNVTRYTYNSGGFLTEVRDHNSNLIESYTYYDIPSHETLPKVKTVTDSRSKVETYLYDEGEGSVTITDNNNRQNITWYDKMLYPIRIKDAEGKEQHIEYNLISGVNKYGEERVVIDRRGNATYYDRDTSGNVIRKINPDGSIKEYGYDSKNNLISEKDELGKLTFYAYDSDKINLVKTARPLNGTDVYSDTSNPADFSITANTYYTSSEAQTMCGKVITGLLKTTTDPEGNVTTYTYDTNGNIATIKNALNQTAAYQYNPVGWLKQETSVKGYVTQYYYDRNGNIIKKVRNGGETERTIFDYRGRITQNIRPNQYVSASDTASAYNANNILTNTNTYSVAGAGYRYIYFANGLLQKETDPLNYETNYTYDQYGNVLTKTYPNGYTEVYTYDVLNRVGGLAYKETSTASAITMDTYSYLVASQGNLEKIRTHYFNSTYAPESAVSKEIYDYADRLIRTDNADGGYSINEYAANGNLSVTTDPMGYKVYYTYDGFNREIGSWVEVSSGICSYEGKEYDKNGNVIKVTGSRNTTAAYSVPSGSTRYDTYMYDAVGRILEQGDSQGGRITYAYDDTTDKATQRQYTSGSEYNETEILFNHLGKVKETNKKVNSGDMIDAVSNLKTTYTFDKEGNVLAETKQNNVATTYTYDLLGRKLTSSEPGINESGQAVTLTNTYTYDFRGNLLTEKDPLNRTTAYTYSPAGLLQKKTDAKTGISYTERTPDNLLVSEITPKNYIGGTAIDQMNRKTYQYDLMGRVVKEYSIYKNSSGTFQTILVEYTYDMNGNLLTSKDGMGYITTYTYDRQNRQLTMLDPDANDRGLSFTTKYTYDGLGKVTSIENGVHAITSYDYNDQGKVLTTAVAGVTIKTCTYDLAGNMLSESDGNGNATSYTYNALGKVRTLTLPGDESTPFHTASYQYTNLGDLAKSVDTLNKVNTYTYDNQQRLLSETEKKSDDSGSITKSYRYDLAGNMRFSVDGRGNTTEYTYDALNQKISQKVSVTLNGTVTAQSSSFAYDADGMLTGTTDWLGNEYENVYDSLGRLVAKKNPYNVTMEAITYDSNHRQIGSTDALGNVATFAYDKANRLISKTDASGHTESKAYDAAGNIISTTDGNGNVIEYQYDANNRLISVTNDLEEVTLYTYDDAGNLLIQTDGEGNVTTYEYSCRNLLVARIDTGGISGSAIDTSKAEFYQYNSDGKLSTKTDRNGVETLYTYDIHGRLLSEDAGGELVSYTYDNNNNQLTMTDSTGTTTRAYDELNRVTSKAVPTIGTTNFVYDQTAGLTVGYVSESYTDPKGNTVLRTKDKAGRLYQVNNNGFITTYTYFANGNLQKLEYPNGSSEQYTYYANNKLHTLVNKQGSSTIEAFSYEYDGAGNMTGKADRKGTTVYTYDELNRLQTVTEPGEKVTAYEYDAAGNRISETITIGSDATRIEYEYNGQNRLIGTKTLVNSEETGGTEYSFDNNGNVLSALPYTLSDAVTSSAMTIDISVLGSPQTQNVTGTAIYEYDGRNQMVRALEGGYTVESEYNGEGLRVSKTVNGETSNFLYEYDKIILETDGSNAKIAQNIYGTNLISRNVGNSSLYYLYNGHGDVTSLKTTDGITAVQYYYDAFGTITEETAAVNNPFRYAGYEYDDETELYYLKSRFYNSMTARFMQEDTYRGKTNDPLSLNLYTYCHNNPVIYDDPSGHGLLTTIAIVVGAIVGSAKKNHKNSSSSSGSSGNTGTSQTSTTSGDTSSSSNSNGIVVNHSDSYNSLVHFTNVIQSFLPNSVKPTNEVSADSIIYPNDTLKRFIQIGGGKMWVDENDRTLIHTIVNGIPVDYKFKNGILYDAKTSAIVGTPEKSGDAKDYVKVSGNYYNFTFGGTGYAKTSIQKIGGKDYVVYKVGNQTFYANGKSTAEVIYPLKYEAQISSAYLEKRNTGLGYHTGVDLKPQVRNTTTDDIISSTYGTVVSVVNNWKPDDINKKNGTMGNYVIIKSEVNGETLYFVYEHLSTVSSDVKIGTELSQGEALGYMGSTGRSTGVHLHFEIRNGTGQYGQDVNPWDYIPDAPR